MPMSDIKIYRQLPIINGFIQVPPNKESDKTRVSDIEPTDSSGALFISGATVKRFGYADNTGSKHGRQKFYELPGVAADSWYASGDPLAAFKQ
jgi:hypothetical protein